MYAELKSKTRLQKAFFDFFFLSHFGAVSFKFPNSCVNAYSNFRSKFNMGGWLLATFSTVIKSAVRSAFKKPLSKFFQYILLLSLLPLIWNWSYSTCILDVYWRKTLLQMCLRYNGPVTFLPLHILLGFYAFHYISVKITRRFNFITFLKSRRIEQRNCKSKAWQW